MQGASGTPSAPAWFGKIASLGDFAKRRMSEQSAAAFDAWLARSVEASRLQLGERWLDVYLTAPLWRFALSPGCLDRSWWFGVLMSSCDNVGRYFPLVVAQSAAAAPSDSQDLGALESWFDGVAHAALATLQQGSSVEAFEADLASVPAWAAPQAAPRLSAMPAAQSAERVRWELPGGAMLGPSLQDLAATETLRRLNGSSLWWPLRPDSASGSLSIATGLPQAGAFSQMLEGTW